MAFTVERGTLANTGFRWNETDDRWEVTHDGSAYFPIQLVVASDPGSPVEGFTWFNTTSNQLKFYDGSTTRIIASISDIPSAPAGASQADQEAGTSTTQFVTPSVQKYHPSAAKAWGYIDQDSSQSVLASHNVSSIVDEGLSLTTVNLTTAFSSTNYSLVASGSDSCIVNDYTASRTVSSFKVGCITYLGNPDDIEFSFVAYGDQ